MEAFSGVTELILAFHKKIEEEEEEEEEEKEEEEETTGRGIRQNVTKLGKRLARRFPKEGHVFLASEI